MEFTDNKGVDYILDPVCAQNFELNIACCNMDARWVVYGFLGGFQLNFANAPGGEPCGLNLSLLFRKRVSLLTTTLRNRPVDYKTELMKAFTERCNPAFESGALKLIIDEPLFTYSKIAEAMQKM